MASELDTDAAGSHPPASTSSRAIEQRFPFKLCDHCGRTRTSWCVNYAVDPGNPGSYPIWKRKCPYCMTPDEHQQMMWLVENHLRVRTTYKYGSRNRTA